MGLTHAGTQRKEATNDTRHTNGDTLDGVVGTFLCFVCCAYVCCVIPLVCVQITSASMDRFVNSLTSLTVSDIARRSERETQTTHTNQWKAYIRVYKVAFRCVVVRVSIFVGLVGSSLCGEARTDHPLLHCAATDRRHKRRNTQTHTHTHTHRHTSKYTHTPARPPAFVLCV